MAQLPLSENGTAFQIIPRFGAKILLFKPRLSQAHNSDHKELNPKLRTKLLLNEIIELAQNQSQQCMLLYEKSYQ